MVEKLNFLEKELEMKQNLVGEGFVAPPPIGSVRVNVMGEILSAENFTCNDLYIHHHLSSDFLSFIEYELILPPYFMFDYDEMEEVTILTPEIKEELNRKFVENARKSQFSLGNQ